MKNALLGTSLLGSGCGSVGRAVASNTRGLRFEFSHHQNLYRTFVNCQLNRKVIVYSDQCRGHAWRGASSNR